MTPFFASTHLEFSQLNNHEILYPFVIIAKILIHLSFIKSKVVLQLKIQIFLGFSLLPMGEALYLKILFFLKD